MDHLLHADSLNHCIWLKWQHARQDLGSFKKLYRANEYLEHVQKSNGPQEQ